MTLYQARKWLIVASLAMTVVAFCFFMVAPVLGYPLRYSQAQTVLQIVLPVFLGYLGAATQFVFQKSPAPDEVVAARPLMGLLVKGPIAVSALMIVAVVVAFGYSNRAAATPGEGLAVEQLSAAVTAAMGLLAATTNSIVAYLFAVEKKAVRPSAKKG
jgi:hypothetical protein